MAARPRHHSRRRRPRKCGRRCHHSVRLTPLFPPPSSSLRPNANPKQDMNGIIHPCFHPEDRVSAPPASFFSSSPRRRPPTAKRRWLFLAWISRCCLPAHPPAPSSGAGHSPPKQAPKTRAQHAHIQNAPSHTHTPTRLHTHPPSSPLSSARADDRARGLPQHLRLHRPPLRDGAAAQGALHGDR